MPERVDWSLANCRGVDPALFFPDRGASHRDLLAVREVCGGCVIRAECLEYALQAVEKFGFWGGHSERERMRMRARRWAMRKAVNG